MGRSNNSQRIRKYSRVAEKKDFDIGKRFRGHSLRREGWYSSTPKYEMLADLDSVAVGCFYITSSLNVWFAVLKVLRWVCFCCNGVSGLYSISLFQRHAHIHLSGTKVKLRDSETTPDCNDLIVVVYSSCRLCVARTVNKALLSATLQCKQSHLPHCNSNKPM